MSIEGHGMVFYRYDLSLPRPKSFVSIKTGSTKCLSCKPTRSYKRLFIKSHSQTKRKTSPRRQKERTRNSKNEISI